MIKNIKLDIKNDIFKIGLKLILDIKIVVYYILKKVYFCKK